MALATLHVEKAPGRLRYRLDTPDRYGLLQEEFDHAIPDTTVSELQARVSALLRRAEAPGFAHEARALGSRLYCDLVPERLRVQLESLTGPILVSTALYGLPLELFHDGQNFLGLRSAVGRRLVMSRQIPPETALRTPDRLQILIIGSDPRGNLPFVESEANSIYEALEPVADVFLLTGAQAAFEDVVARLPKVDVIHYCGHIDRSRAGPSGLLLADERLLSADDIEGTLRETPRRPLVFLNGCASFRGADSATATQWEEDLSSVAYGFIFGGARAVVGTLSDVSDRHAALLATEFYRRIVGGQSLGEALRGARSRCREVAPHSPTWLSFVLYGSPMLALTSDGPVAALVPEASKPTIPPAEKRSLRRLSRWGMVALLVAALIIYMWPRPQPVAILTFSETHLPGQPPRCGEPTTELELGKTLVVCVTLSNLNPNREYNVRFEVVRNGHPVYIPHGTIREPLSAGSGQQGGGSVDRFIAHGTTYHLAWDLDSWGKIPDPGVYSFRFYLNGTQRDHRDFTFVSDISASPKAAPSRSATSRGRDACA